MLTRVPLSPAVRRLLFGLALASALLAIAAPARADVRVIRPVAVNGSVVTFDLRSVSVRGLASVRLHQGSRKRRLDLRDVRRAARRGRLHVRVRRAPRRTRLVLARSARKKTRATAPRTDSGTRTEPTTPGATDAVPGSSSLTCGWGSFKVGIWPGGCWRPYNDSSPFNQRIPAGAKLLPNSAEVVSRLVAGGPPMNGTAGHADTPDDYGHPTYYSQPTDPVFKIDCQAPWGRCAIEGHEIRIPDAARAAAGGDAHMTVVDQVSGWEYDFWQVRSKPAGGGTIAISWGGRTRIDGNGLGSDAVAARYGGLAGIIRAQEMFAGRIDHALFMGVPCDAGTFVYPALKGARACSDIGKSNENAPSMGMRFQLDMSVAEIEAMAVPRWKKTILRALAEYGAFVGDTGGSSWGIGFESGSTYTSFGMEDEMVRFGRQNNLPMWDGKYVFRIRDGVDWSRMKVVDPCVTQGTC